MNPNPTIIKNVASVLNDYHIDMLKDPTITDLTPYIKRILHATKGQLL